MADRKWTNSSLSALQDCGERYRRRYIELERRPGSPRMHRGSAVHAAISFTLNRKMELHELPTVAEVKDLTATDFKKRWEEGVTLEPGQKTLGESAVRDHAKDVSIALAVKHLSDVAPTITPVGVEYRVTLKPKDMDITIEGTIDQIDRRPEGDVLRDPKTSEKAPAGDVAETSQQLTMYGLLWLAKTGVMPAGYRLDYLWQTPKEKRVEHRPILTTRDAEDMNALVRRLNTSVEAVKRGTFVPANETWWGCSAAWCEFHGDCVYVRRGSRPQS